MKHLLFIFTFSLFSFNSEGQAWLPMGSGTLGLVVSLAADTQNHRLFAGGNFSTIDTITANNIAIWDGTKWLPFIHDGNQNGFSGIVDKLLVWNNYLYYSDANFLKRINLSTLLYETIGTFNSGGITDLIIYKDILYVSGNFTNIIYKWNNPGWINVSAGLGVGWGYDIMDMEVADSLLYVAGDFEITSPHVMKGVAAYNGMTWIDVDSNLTANIGDMGVYYYSVKKYHDKLYLGGG